MLLIQRFTDEYVDFLYSSVEKNVDWTPGNDEDIRQDIYSDVVFLRAPRWISQSSFTRKDTPGDPPPIVKRTSFPRVRIAPSEECVRGQVFCDFERRPLPGAFLGGEYPTDDSSRDEWEQAHSEWLASNDHLLDPPGITLTAVNLIKVGQDIIDSLIDGFMNPPGLPSVPRRIAEVQFQQFVRAFPEWRLG
jgi:hypothetical protein